MINHLVSMKKLLFFIFFSVLSLFFIAPKAEAINITVPQSTAKADILVGKAGGAYGILNVGSNGQCLLASSTTASGLVWAACASGSLGITTLNSQTGATQTFATNTTATGLNLNVTSTANVHTWALSLQSGYGIPLTASTSEWTNFNNTPSTRITAGNGLSWSGNTLSNTMASSTLIAGGTATFSPSVTIATSTDTNLLLQVVCATATCTFTPQWTGTLAAARLNSNVVQAITNDTNVTGSISAQNLTLGWTGVLAASRGGIGTTTLGDLTVSSSNLSITGGQKVLIGTSTQITLTDNPTFTKGTFTNASTSALTASGNVYLTGLTSQNCIGTTAAGLLQAGTCTGGSGNSAWTIGNGLIYNATSTDSVLIGTSTPTSATMYLQGSGTKAPLTIASSTGSTLLSLDQSGILKIAGTNTSARVTITDTTAQLAILSGNNVASFFQSTSALTITPSGNLILSVAGSGNVGINTTSPQTKLDVYGAATIDPFNISSSSNVSLLRVTAAGNLGVGTTTPLARLDVWGNFNVATGSTPALFVNTATGKVGINSSSPTSTFTVSDSKASSSVQYIGGPGAPPERGCLALYDYGQSAYVYMWYHNGAYATSTSQPSDCSQ